MKPPSSSSSRKSSTSRTSYPPSFSFYLIVIAFILFVSVLYGEDFTCITQQSFIMSSQSDTYPEGQQPAVSPQELPFTVGRTEKGCNVFEGRWVYDEEARPLYEEEECPYIEPQVACQAYGRPDRGYQHWRWQPHGCTLPSFNATMMLEMLRGKRMLYVGDSLSRGQFESMVCLLHRAIPVDRKSIETIDSLTVFTAVDYNATVEFYWAPFLVESNCDDAVGHRVADRIVRGRSINKHARQWKGADIIVFNTYLWWMNGMNMKILTGPFTRNLTNIELLETNEAYRVALTRMVKWVEKNMNPDKTRVFFTTISPTHWKSKEWGAEPGGNCLSETTPVEDPTYWGSGSRKGTMQVLKEVLSSAKVPITAINITQLSEYRKDAHTAIYKKRWVKPTPEQLANPKSYADCVHWCLPGLQDTWNELLYTKLFFPN